MHMADALLSTGVGLAMCGVSVGVMAYSAAAIKRDELSEKKLPLMAVAGAFVFAAQMINFTIPGTGSSGHIGGGILLAVLLGGHPAFLTMSAVLIIQSLFFADGGLLALGCNIFNLGVIPCLVVYPLLFKPLTKRGFSLKNISLAAIVSVVVGLQLGAFGVVVETVVSGVAALPLGSFVTLMQPIHLAIGLTEGLVTASILCFIYKMRSEILESARVRKAITPAEPIKKVILVFCIVTLVVGGGLSIFASTDPDGLEWSVEQVAGTAQRTGQGEQHQETTAIQESLSFLPGYDYPAQGEATKSGTVVAGILGSAITFVLAGAVGFGISRAKKKKKSSTPL